MIIRNFIWIVRLDLNTYSEMIISPVLFMLGFDVIVLILLKLNPLGENNPYFSISVIRVIAVSMLVVTSEGVII